MGGSSSKTLGAKSTAKEVISFFEDNPETKGLTDLSGQTIVITGCNAGIGKHTVQSLFSLGATVIMACRNVEKAGKARLEVLQALEDQVPISPAMGEEEARDARLKVMQMDLNSLKSVFDFAVKLKSMLIKSEIPPLKNLICNAGIMALKEYETSEDGIEKQFQVNYLGHYYLIRLLWPLLIEQAQLEVGQAKSAEATGDDASDVTTAAESKEEEKKEEEEPTSSAQGCRVLLLASSAHRFSKPISEMVGNQQTWLSSDRSSEDPWQSCYGPWTSYGFSKAVSILGAREFHKQGNGKKLRFVAVHPGVIMTDLWKNSSTSRKIAGSAFQKSVAQGTATTIFCSLMPFDTLDGGYYADCKAASEKVTADVKKTEFDAKLSEVCDLLISQRGFSFDLDSSEIEKEEKVESEEAVEMEADGQTAAADDDDGDTPATEAAEVEEPASDPPVSADAE